MFKIVDAAKLRAMDADAFEEYRSALIDALDSADCEYTTAELRAAADDVKADIERRNAAIELRNAAIEKVAAGAGKVVERSAEPKGDKGFEVVRSEDPFDTDAYNEAFFKYMTRGEKTPGIIQPGQRPAYLRADQFTTVASDVPNYVPTHMMNDILEKSEDYGRVWPMLTKTNVQGGVQYPTGSFEPTASWVTETAPSEAQKLADDEPISFSYYMLECKLAQSFLSSATTIEAFQRKFPEAALKAVIKKLEEGYLNGTGTGQMTGILNDSRIPSDNKIALTADDISGWEGWHKKVKAKMKVEYRDGIFIMNQATFDAYIDGMVDANGQPVARCNYGLNGEETYRFMGRQVLIVGDSFMKSFDDGSNGDAFALFTKPSDYAVNSNMAMRAVRWTDEDNNLYKNKVQTIVDGKILRPWGTLILTKSAA